MGEDVPEGDGGQKKGASRTHPTLCARHVVILGGASPLRAVMTGTARLGKGVRREAESEGSRCRNSDPTNRNRIQGRRGWVTRQWTGTPDSHSDAHAGKSGGARGKEARLTLGDLRSSAGRSGLPPRQRDEEGR